MLSLKKISLFLALIGVTLLFLPIWVGSTNLMPIGVVLLVASLLLFNKARLGTFFPKSNTDDTYDRLNSDFDSDSGFSGGGGDSGGGGASGDWDDSDDDN